MTDEELASPRADGPATDTSMLDGLDVPRKEGPIDGKLNIRRFVVLAAHGCEDRMLVPLFQGLAAQEKWLSYHQPRIQNAGDLRIVSVGVTVESVPEITTGDLLAEVKLPAQQDWKESSKVFRLEWQGQQDSRMRDLLLEIYRKRILDAAAEEKWVAISKPEIKKTTQEPTLENQTGQVFELTMFVSTTVAEITAQDILAELKLPEEKDEVKDRIYKRKGVGWLTPGKSGSRELTLKSLRDAVGETAIKEQWIAYHKPTTRKEGKMNYFTVWGVVKA